MDCRQLRHSSLWSHVHLPMLSRCALDAGRAMCGWTASRQVPWQAKLFEQQRRGNNWYWREGVRPKAPHPAPIVLALALEWFLVKHLSVRKPHDHCPHGRSTSGASTLRSRLRCECLFLCFSTKGGPPGGMFPATPSSCPGLQGNAALLPVCVPHVVPATCAVYLHAIAPSCTAHMMWLL